MLSAEARIFQASMTQTKPSASSNSSRNLGDNENGHLHRVEELWNEGAAVVEEEEAAVEEEEAVVEEEEAVVKEEEAVGEAEEEEAMVETGERLGPLLGEGSFLTRRPSV